MAFRAPHRSSARALARALPRALLLLAAAGAGTRSGSAFGSASGTHPQDGPDADVRLRVEDAGVELAIVVNLAFADEIVEIPREDEENLHPAEYGVAEELLFEFFSTANRLHIDGVEVTPREVAFEVLPPDPDLLPHFPRFGTRAMTKLRLVLDYPAKAPPGRVELVWGPYPPDYVLAGPEGIPPLEIVAHLQAGAERQRIVFTRETPRHAWQASAASGARLLAVPPPRVAAPWVLPALSIGLWFAAGLGGAAGLRRRRGRAATFAACAVAVGLGFAARSVGQVEVARAAEPPTREEALAVFTPLHANIYRAFDYGREDAVYDALARSVHGDLLDELYTQVHASLVQQDQGGAVSEVQAVRPLETEVEALERDDRGRPRFTVVARWQVDGAVFHWGHSHWRTNEYRARYSVGVTDAGWRILDDEVLEQRRIDAGPLDDAVRPTRSAPPGDPARAEERDF